MFRVRVKTSDFKKLERFAKEVKDNRAVFNALIAQRMKFEIQNEIAKFTKSGALKDSFTLRRNAASVTITSNSDYAQIQDEGGTVNRKVARKLIIPKNDRARNLIQNRDKRLIFLPGSIRFRRGAVKEFLAARKLSVRLPPKHYFNKALSKAERKIVKDLDDMIQRLG